jgi:hypothetical protein
MVSILLAAALLIQARSGPTPDEARMAMALGACIASHARQFATRPDADDVIAATIVDACADLERGVAAVSSRMAGREGAAEAARRVHADILRRTLTIVREVRTGSLPTGPGSEVQIWSYCVTQHVIRRAGGQGSPDEVVHAAEGDCGAEEAAVRAAILRQSGPAAGPAEMEQLRTLGRERQLILVARIRASRDANAPSVPEPR